VGNSKEKDMVRPHLNSDLISWKYIRIEQLIAFCGVGLIMFLSVCAYVSSKCLYTLAQSATADIQVQAFWSPDYPLDKIQSEWKKADNLPAVIETITFTPSQALHKIQKELGPSLDFSWLDKNPLPPTAIFRLSPGNDQPALDIIQKIRDLPGVDKVHTNPLQLYTAKAWQELLHSVLWPLISLLLLTQAVLLANTVRLVLFKLESDIHVLRLVGANRRDCQLPIIIRMLFLTAVGTTAALGGAKFLHFQVSAIVSSPPLHIPCPFLSFIELSAIFLCAFVVTGLSCSLAIHKHGM
jgi:cell division transport system permease protein